MPVVVLVVFFRCHYATIVDLLIKLDIIIEYLLQPHTVPSSGDPHSPFPHKGACSICTTADALSRPIVFEMRSLLQHLVVDMSAIGSHFDPISTVVSVAAKASQVQTDRAIRRRLAPCKYGSGRMHV